VGEALQQGRRPQAKRICVTVKDGRVESGLLVVSVAIIEMDGEQKKLLRMSLPYGVALAARHPADRRPGPARDVAVRDLPAAGRSAGRLHRRLRSVGRHDRPHEEGQILTVQAIHMNGQAMSPQLDLKDFAKAYDGPPTDPKVFEEQQKKLQDELQKRAEEARKRLESQPPQAGGRPPARYRRRQNKGPPRGGPFVCAAVQDQFSIALRGL
jgi:hypothetical protein